MTKRVLEPVPGVGVALVENAQGARLLVGRVERGVLDGPVTVARTRGEARALVASLRDLAQDLPESVEG